MRGKGEGSVFKDSRGLWTAVVELPPRDGKRRRKTIRRKNKKEVLLELAKAKKQLQDSGDIITDGQTVEQWFRFWLKDTVTRTKRPNTASNYRTVVEKYIIPTIGKIPMSKVKAMHVERVTRAMTDSGLSSTYALNAYAIMAASFKDAYKAERLPANPIKKATPPGKEVARLEVLTLDEALVVMRHVTRTDESGRFVDPLGARWAVALLTGLRRGEALGLEVDRVGEKIDNSWQIQRLGTGARGAAGEPGKPIVPVGYEYRHLEGGLYLTRPKSKAGKREIPMFEPLESILKKHIADSGAAGLVFTIDGKPIDPSRDSANWQKVLREVGIDKKVRLHDLRHTAVDLLYLAGVPEDIIQNIVGHSTRTMTRSYKSQGIDPRTQQALARFGELFTLPSADTPPAIDA